MFCCNSFCNPCCRPDRPPFPGSFLPSAQFGLSAGTVVESGSTIPLNNIFSNAGEIISNNNGVISLNRPGVYFVSYSVSASNTGEGQANALISVLLNGVASPILSSGTQVGPGSTSTVSNSGFITVDERTMSSFSLTITSSLNLSVVPNVSVIKIS